MNYLKKQQSQYHISFSNVELNVLRNISITTKFTVGERHYMKVAEKLITLINSINK